MTLDRAIEIFDPDNPEKYKDAFEIEEAMRMAVAALRMLKPSGAMCVYCGRLVDLRWKWCPYCGRGVAKNV